MTNPTVEIAVVREGRKEVQRVYGGNTVYLNNGAEFELCIKNPTTHVIGAKINFNGDKNVNQLIVLRPGEKIWLDRHILEQKKLKFDAYLVDNDSSTANAIRDNGSLCVEFYKEYKRSSNPLIIREKEYVPYIPYQPYIPYNPYPNPWIQPWNPFPIITYCSSGNVGTSNNVMTGVKPAHDGAPANDVNYSANINYINNECKNVSNSEQIETGRVEMGDNSNQSFTNACYEFDILPFHTVDMKMLPLSQKPITVSDIKLYCSKCSRRQRRSEVYCPKCGTKYDG